MKSTVAVFALLAGISSANSMSASPIERVVQLIGQLKTKVEDDGKAEQQGFDKYACWCEKTLERKAADISNAKELIGETEILIKKLEGEIASHGAEITQLNKDIAQNIESQKEATAVRTKDYNEYSDERTESEQCIGAMEAAIKVLTGAGTKKGFLDTTAHQAQLMSVAASVRTVFRTKNMPTTVSQKDLDLVKRFVAKPEDFMGPHAVAMSAAQVGQNPFGDYAPQSSQIQGILKGMYDAFAGDLEKDNANESGSEKSFQALMATKAQEKETLEATLETQEADQASKNKKLTESQVLKDDTAEQLAADEAFFADSKEACKSKATEWSIRTRLRTEELRGMQEAVQILSSEDAKGTFKDSSSTFLQVASVQEHSSAKRDNALDKLKKLAAKFSSVKVAKIAAALQLGGHFDKVIVQIDGMIALLRKEEAEDIVHRDMCENSQNANSNEMADLESTIKKANAMIKRMETAKGDLEIEIEKLAEDIRGTRKEQSDLLDFRNTETANFRQAVKDDTDAVALIQKAIGALSKFYKDNKIPLALAQKAPEYAKDADKAPDAGWSGSDYGGRKSESGGILAILAMLSEDLEKEIADARGDDADAQSKYEKQNGALQGSLDAQEATHVNLEEEKAGVEMKINAAEEFRDGKSNDKDAEGQTEKAIATDCNWVKSHFETRRDKRKNEIDGLVDAKAFLAGGGEEI